MIYLLTVQQHSFPIMKQIEMAEKKYSTKYIENVIEAYKLCSTRGRLGIIKSIINAEEITDYEYREFFDAVKHFDVYDLLNLLSHYDYDIDRLITEEIYDMLTEANYER